MNPAMKLTALAICCGLAVAPAHAGLTAKFSEGAPKDRFTFTNNSDCELNAVQLLLDLSGSSAGLIFDTTPTGRGVEVYQPFEIVAGSANLQSTPEVKDGDNQLVLNVKTLSPGDSIAFTIDVDDTAGGREITVDGSEIRGASVRVDGSGITSTALFDDGARADMAIDNCKSS